MNKLSQKSLIEIAGVLIVLGALIIREFRIVGFVLILTTIGLYTISQSKLLIYRLKNFGYINALQRVGVLTALMLIYIFAEAIISGEVSFFLMLVALGVDYFVCQKKDL